MSQIKGHVGKWELVWKKAPHGAIGSSEVDVVTDKGNSVKVAVHWRRDAHGLWIELPQGVYGYDLNAHTSDEGRVAYRVSQRASDHEWSHLHFTRPGEETETGSAVGGKKGLRVRAQMPGKMIRVMVIEGAVVEKDQPIAVMEAMKMENEIRAPQGGRISKVAIAQGQAVETGADLFVIDPI